MFKKLNVYPININSIAKKLCNIRNIAWWHKVCSLKSGEGSGGEISPENSPAPDARTSRNAGGHPSADHLGI